MALESRRLTLEDVESRRGVATLHQQSLPDSMVSVFGPAVLDRYYEFLVRSECEVVFVCHQDGRVAGGAVLSAQPDTLTGRFVKRASPGLIWRIAIGTVRSTTVAKRVARSVHHPKALEAVAGSPEVVQVFVDPAVQSRGIGRDLLAAVERHLAGSGHHSYFVKTLAAEDNRALGFYARLGFVPVGEQSIQGFRYRFLSKRLP